MKTATVVLPPDLLNILLKRKIITQLSLPILHALTTFTATAKLRLFTHSLFQCKKEMNAQMVEFQRGQD